MLPFLLNFATIVFAVSSMLAVGFSYPLKRILEPLRNPAGVLLILLLNFVLVPLLAYAISSILALSPSVTLGIMLVASAGGAPVLIPMTRLAHGDTAYASGVLVLLLVATIVYLPLIVPVLAPGAEVSVWLIAGPLVLTILLPLCIGLYLDARWPPLNDFLLPTLNKLAGISLVLLVLATVLVNIREILGLGGTGILPAAVLLIISAAICGYGLGGSTLREQKVTGLGTGQRNIAAALVVATQSIDNNTVTVTIVVTSLVSLAVLFAFAWLLSKRQELSIHRAALAGERRAPWV